MLRRPFMNDNSEILPLFPVDLSRHPRVIAGGRQGRIGGHFGLYICVPWGLS